MPEFQSHNTLRLLLLRINCIQLQKEKSNNFHGMTIKTKKDFGELKLGQIQVHIIMTCALRGAIKKYMKFLFYESYIPYNYSENTYHYSIHLITI